jgi:hypothetical protein
MTEPSRAARLWYQSFVHPKEQMRRSNVSLCAATTKQLWLIWTSSQSRSPSRLRGLIRSIRARNETAGLSLWG